MSEVWEFAESFDYRASGFNQTISGWNNSFQRIDESAAYGGSGKGAVILDRNNYRTISQTLNEVCLGFHYMPHEGLQNSAMLRFLANFANTTQLVISRLTNGELRLTDGAAVDHDTEGAGLSSTSAWKGIEVRVLFDPSAGEVEIMVDGDQKLLVTGIDTQVSAFNDCTGIQFNSDGPGYRIDNVMFRDFTVVPVMFGVAAALSQHPDGEGDETDGTPTGAATNHEAVDEVVSDGDTSYSALVAAGEKQLYTFPAHGIVQADVLGVQLIHVARKDDGATRKFKPILKNGATTVQGSEVTLSGSYEESIHIFTDVPGGTGWTLAQVDANQAGEEVTVG